MGKAYTLERYIGGLNVNDYYSCYHSCANAIQKAKSHSSEKGYFLVWEVMVDDDYMYVYPEISYDKENIKAVVINNDVHLPSDVAFKIIVSKTLIQ